MIGEVHIVGNDTYVESNTKGTWEKLPVLGWFRQLQLYIASQFDSRWTVEDTREFCRVHRKTSSIATR